MKARQLVAGASLGPEALKVAYEAFDQAWDAIAANFGSDKDAIEAGRLKLANAILAVMREDGRDAVQVKNAALRMVALKGRVPAQPTQDC
jgi:hypothetical protein